MIIDFHTHTFPDKIAKGTMHALEECAHIKATREGTVQALLGQMEESGVDLSVIMPVVTKPSQFQSVNDCAAMINDTYPGRLISFGGIHPNTQNYKEELSYIASLGIKGIKLHPDYQGVFIDDMAYLRIIDRAVELGLVIMLHAGVDIGMPTPVHCPPDRARKMIREIQPQKLILAHFGGWKQWDEVEDFLVGQNVYFDCAFCSNYFDSMQFERMVKAHGADKILFATDSPWENPSDTIKWIESTNLSQDEKDRIYSFNAKKLLALAKT